MNEMKVCGRCKKCLPVSQFYWRADRCRHTSKCKECFADYQREYKNRADIKDMQRQGRAEWQRSRVARSRSELSDDYIKKLLVQKTTLSWRDIPYHLVALKRLQIEIQRFIKEQK